MTTTLGSTTTTVVTTTTTTTLGTIETDIRLPPGWSAVAELPFSVNSGAVIVGTEDRFVVAQGNEAYLIGHDGDWTRLFESPLSVQRWCCGDVQGHSAGTDFILTDPNGRTFLLSTTDSQWRRVPDRPQPGYTLGSVWDGTELTLLLACRPACSRHHQVVSLNPQSGEWRVSPPLPGTISVGGIALSDGMITVSGTHQASNNAVIGDRNPVMYVYGGERWIVEDPVPIDGQAPTIVRVEGVGLLAWNYSMEAALLRLDESWERIGDAPMTDMECYPLSVTVEGGAVAQFCDQLAWFDAQLVRWDGIPTLIGRETRFVVLGDRIMGLVDLDLRRTLLITWPLARS